ncbi:hypothetical protein Tco_0823897 [Tanacetum coccineum]|uniref:Retrovirus-related Pol polyprotein from transposon TNT 1-94-like beta-barrel domain-containing protein n=1 Tax=Tanacetum coccineum TaxID=301880 RepID=A0ABQ5ANB5_9ASTR
MFEHPELWFTEDHTVVDSGCSSYMTGNKAYLLDYEDYNGVFMAFGSDPKGGKITGKGKIRTANLEFDDVYFVDELKFNLFFISQMCDKKNSVLFTDTECLIQSLALSFLMKSVVLRAPDRMVCTFLDLRDQPHETSSSHATTQDSRDTLEGTNKNEGDQELSVLCTNLSNKVLALESIKDAQAAEISALKSRIKKLEKKCKPSISHHRAWLKSMNRLSVKKRFRKSTVFDDQDHGMEYMETEEPVDEGKQSGETEEVKLTDDTKFVEDKGSGDKGGNAKELVSTARPEVSTARPDIDAARQEDSAVEPRTPPTTTRYPALKVSDANFVPIGSERDEKMIDKMNKKAAGMEEEEVPESTKVEVKKEGHEENIRKRLGRRLKMKPTNKSKRKKTVSDRRLKMKPTNKSKRKKTVSDLEEEEQLRDYLKIVPDEEEEIDYEVLGMRYPIVNWVSAFYHTDRYGVPHDYYRVFRANGSSRYIKTFTEMVSRFDRLDFIELHSLVMQRFSTTTPEGIDLVLWGDLRIMFEETADDGTEIHMLAERRYPLIRETLERMIELRLTTESEGEAIFDLLRFIQKQIDEFEGQDRSEKDL